MSKDVIWQPDEYLNLSHAQKKAAAKLIEQLQIKFDDHILDVGCGEGKISADLSKIASSGRILGIDKSKEMIQFANQNFSLTQYPNLEFRIEDAQEISYSSQFDIVFSCFALQWVRHKGVFFKRAYNSLKVSGRLAVIIPLAVSPELDQAVDKVTNLPKWKSYFTSFHPNWYFADSSEIIDVIKECKFEITNYSTILQEVCFPSIETLKNYILLWFPYLSPLPDGLKNDFFEEVMMHYFELLPPMQNGLVTLRIPRMDLIARKN